MSPDISSECVEALVRHGCAEIKMPSAFGAGRWGQGLTEAAGSGSHLIHLDQCAVQVSFSVCYDIENTGKNFTGHHPLFSIFLTLHVLG